MKRVAMVLGIAGVMSAAFPAGASEELAKKHACFACHTVDRKMVGPSYKDVAAKYRNDKAAAAELASRRW